MSSNNGGLLSRLFGKKGDKAPTPAEATQKLREVSEMMTKKSDYLEKKVQEETLNAKKHGMKNKRAALMALKRKKRIEKQLAQIDGVLSTVEFQLEALENANTNTEVFKVMGVASKALKKVHENMDADEVHNLMDDIHEQQEIAQEISEAISNPVGFGNDVDEDELMAELEELEQEDLDKELIGIEAPPVTDDLPSVPSTTLPAAPVAESKASNKVNDELAELAAWAN